MLSVNGRGFSYSKYVFWEQTEQNKQHDYNYELSQTLTQQLINKGNLTPLQQRRPSCYYTVFPHILRFGVGLNLQPDIFCQ